ncbi:unnamed protein product [Sympodiomycopsis kandeliae]
MEQHEKYYPPPQVNRQASMSKSKEGLQIWAVDISAWPEEHSTKEYLEPLLDLFFSHETDSSNVSSDKVMRYLRGIDRIRALAALLLPRIMYCQVYDLKWKDLAFDRTKEGRPFLKPSSSLPSPRDFNITHDGDWVILAFNPEVARVGIDVMSIALPHYESSVDSFVETMTDTMTSQELSWVKSSETQAEGLNRLYDLWTYKEALTKNMGMGLGFDFKRIEFRFWNSKHESDRNKRQTQTGESILNIDGVVDKRFTFTSVRLLAHEQKTPSQVVVCQGPLSQDEFHLQTQISPIMDMKVAKEGKLLQVWDMAQIISIGKGIAGQT